MSRFSGTRPKRSMSLTHIPIPTSVRESRTSIRGNIRVENELCVPRKTSLDRKSQRSSSCSNLLRVTPLQNKPSGRTSSTRKAPSSASRSPFNRHISDKKWVSEQFMKVKRYLETHPNCDPNVVNCLKPPTLNTFVTVCNVLLKDLDPRIDINLSNYKEALVAQLKTLHYPGTVSNSLLKTVNTMHAWPQVMAILSWIVDLLRFITVNTVNPDTSDANSEIKEVILDYFAERYLLFNENEDQTSADEVFINNIAAIYDINDEELNEFGKGVENLRNILQEKIFQLSKITDEIDGIHAENVQMEKEIKKFNIEDSAHEQEQDYILETLMQKKQEMKNMISEVRENISKLRVMISNQCCSHIEKKSILANINEMKYTLELKKKKKEEFMKFKSEFDYNMVKAKRNVEAEVYRLNTAMVQMSLTYPEIKSFHLRDRGFHHMDFKREIDEFIETIAGLENQLTENIAKAETQIHSSDKQCKIFSDQMKQLTETTEELSLKINEVEKRIESVAENHKTVVISAEQIKNQYLSAIENFKSKEPNLKDIELQITQLIEDKSLLENQFNLRQTECLQFFQSLCHTSITNLNKLNDMRVSISEKINSEENLAVKNYNEIIKKVEGVTAYFTNSETDGAKK